MAPSTYEIGLSLLAYRSSTADPPEKSTKHTASAGAAASARLDILTLGIRNGQKAGASVAYESSGVEIPGSDVTVDIVADFGTDRSTRMRRMKIDLLMISRAYPPLGGGVASHVQYLAEALSNLTKRPSDPKRLCRVRLVTATGTGPKPLSNGIPPFLDIHHMPSENSHFVPVGDVPFEHTVQYLLDSWTRAIRADVIHVHDFEALQIGLMLKAAFKVPLIMTMHRAPRDADRTLPERNVKDCFLEVVRRFGLLDKLVAPSEAYKRHLVGQGFDESTIETIQHGVPISRLSLQANDHTVLARLGIENDDELIFAPVRLDPHKSPETFVDAAALVIPRVERRKLVFAIAGSGKSAYRAELENRARQKGILSAIRFGASDGKDFRHEEMATLFRRARICVLPSTKEGFGQVLLEAGVYKIPVIAANTGGIPEIVVANDTGLLFNRNEPDDLATQIVRLLTDSHLGELLALRAHNRLRRCFDADQMAHRYVRLYMRVAGITSLSGVVVK